HKALDMGGQVHKGLRALLPSKLAERVDQGDAPPNALDRVVTILEPADVRLDLGGDPRAPQSVDCPRLDEVLLQHDNFLSREQQEEAPCRRARRYVPSSWLRMPSRPRQACRPASPPHNGG